MAVVDRRSPIWGVISPVVSFVDSVGGSVLRVALTLGWICAGVLIYSVIDEVVFRYVLGCRRPADAVSVGWGSSGASWQQC